MSCGWGLCGVGLLCGGVLAGMQGEHLGGEPGGCSGLSSVQLVCKQHQVASSDMMVANLPDEIV